MIQARKGLYSTRTFQNQDPLLPGIARGLEEMKDRQFPFKDVTQKI